MDSYDRVEVESFNSEYNILNKATRDKTRNYYHFKVKSLLTQNNFSDDMLEEIATGIVDNGEELMVNAVAESSGYDEIDEVNDISYMCQTMHNLSILWLTLDGGDHAEEKERVSKMLPEPESEYYTFEEEANDMKKFLTELQHFIHNMSKRSFTIFVVFLGKFDKENMEIGFGEKGPVIPIEVMERQVWNQVTTTENVLPEVVHLVFPEPENKDKLFMSMLKKKTGAFEPKRYILEGEKK